MYMCMKVPDKIRTNNNISLHTVSMRIQSSHQLVFTYTFTHTPVLCYNAICHCLSVSPWESSQACCCNQLIILNNSVTIIYHLNPYTQLETISRLKKLTKVYVAKYYITCAWNYWHARYMCTCTLHVHILLQWLTHSLLSCPVPGSRSNMVSNAWR